MICVHTRIGFAVLHRSGKRDKPAGKKMSQAAAGRVSTHYKVRCCRTCEHALQDALLLHIWARITRCAAAAHV